MTTIAPGFLRTDGSQIVDSYGRNVKLTGVNWFGAEGYAFAPQGLWQDSYQTHMDRMKALGFNVIRLPWSDAMLEPGRQPTGIDYSINPDLAGLGPLEVFDRIIDHAGRIGMKIILDHHRSGDGASANENGLWYTDQHPESTMIANWQMLARRYAGNDAVIGADLHNEPHGQATWGDGNIATDWARAAERIGNAIQDVNTDWLLIVEGIEIVGRDRYWWGGNLLNESAHPVTFAVPDRLVYSVHDYGPSIHMMDWFTDPGFPANMPAKWDQMWGHFLKTDDAPILVGEFGSRMETALDQAWMPKLVQYMNGDWDGNGTIDLAPGDQGASWAYWSWSPGSHDTGGILNAGWQLDEMKYTAIRPGLFTGPTLSPLPPSSPEGVPFDPLAYIASHADLSAAIGPDAAAGTRHFQDHGQAEGRTVRFDAYDYLAVNPDIVAGYGNDTTAATLHYIQFGRQEGRSTDGFDAAGYLAGNPDLIAAFGLDSRAAAIHYVTHGIAEGRPLTGFAELG